LTAKIIKLPTKVRPIKEYKYIQDIESYMTELVISGKIDPLLLAAILVTIAGKIGKTQVEKENLDSERLINFLQEKLRKELEIA